MSTAVMLTRSLYHLPRSRTHIFRLRNTYPRSMYTDTCCSIFVRQPSVLRLRRVAHRHHQQHGGAQTASSAAGASCHRGTHHGPHRFQQQRVTTRSGAGLCSAVRPRLFGYVVIPRNTFAQSALHATNAPESHGQPTFQLSPGVFTLARGPARASASARESARGHL